MVIRVGCVTHRFWKFKYRTHFTIFVGNQTPDMRRFLLFLIILLSCTQIKASYIAGVGNHWISYNVNEHCNETDSVVMFVGCDLQLYIPNSFTPNEDGIDETFAIKGKNILTFDLGFYSSNGKELYHTNDMSKAWKGDFKEHIVQTDA